MSNVTINMEEWLAELSRLGVLTDAATEAYANIWTSMEVAKALTKSIGWIRIKIRDALDAGIVVRCRKAIVSIDGKTTHVSAYRFVEKTKSPVTTQTPKPTKKKAGSNGRVSRDFRQVTSRT